MISIFFMKKCFNIVLTFNLFNLFNLFNPFNPFNHDNQGNPGLFFERREHIRPVHVVPLMVEGVDGNTVDYVMNTVRVISPAPLVVEVLLSVARLTEIHDDVTGISGESDNRVEFRDFRLFLLGGEIGIDEILVVR